MFTRKRSGLYCSRDGKWIIRREYTITSGAKEWVVYEAGPNHTWHIVAARATYSAAKTYVENQEVLRSESLQDWLS